MCRRGGIRLFDEGSGVVADSKKPKVSFDSAVRLPEALAGMRQAIRSMNEICEGIGAILKKHASLLEQHDQVLRKASRNPYLSSQKKQMLILKRDASLIAEMAEFLRDKGSVLQTQLEAVDSSVAGFVDDATKIKSALEYVQRWLLATEDQEETDTESLDSVAPFNSFCDPRLMRPISKLRDAKNALEDTAQSLKETADQIRTVSYPDEPHPRFLPTKQHGGVALPKLIIPPSLTSRDSVVDPHLCLSRAQHNRRAIAAGY